MAEVGLLYGDRVWFADARTPMRRLAVSSHPEAGVVILSLWVGDTCTGTFRLPVADAAHLISTLADGMAGALPTGPTPTLVTTTARPSWRDWRGHVLDGLRTRLRRS